MEANHAPPSPTWSPARHLVALLLLSIAAVAAYVPSFRVPFQYDDLWEIMGNRALMDVHDLHAIFSYNPARALLMMTFALDLHFWGANTFPYHLENLFIHLVNTLLVYRIGERLLRSKDERAPAAPGGLDAPSGWAPALAGALIFAVHPLFVEAVTYIASRSSSLATLFYLAAFLAYVRFRDVRQADRSSPAAWGWLFLGVNAYLLAIATKEEGVSLPAVLVAYDLFLAPRPATADGKRPGPGWWLASAPFWLLLVLLVGVRMKLYGTMMPPVIVRSVAENVWTELEVTVYYLRLLVLPYGLSIYHDYPIVYDPARLETIAAGLLHLALISAAIGARKRLPLLSFAIVWFYATLSPTSSFIPLKEPMAEHRMYLAAFGFLWLGGAGLGALRTAYRVPPLVVGVVLAVPLAVLTFRYNRLWQDEVALWQQAVQLAPHSGDANYALGDALARRGRLKEAEEAYKQSLENYEKLGIPRNVYKYSYVDALNNLGLVYGRQGNLDFAISYFRRALEHNLGYTQGWNNLGYAQLQKGNYLEASFSFEEAVRTDPDSWLAHYHLGNLYYESLADPRKAAQHYKRVLELNPDIPGADKLKARLIELGF